MAIDLWHSTDVAAWLIALDSYDDVVAAQGVKSLVALDQWFRSEFPSVLSGRRPAYVTVEELVKLTEWKMARGVWRARNLALVKGNDADAVKRVSTRALAKIPHPTAPITDMAELEGVGPATASAVASTAAPELYPFFDDLVAKQIPRLGDVAFTHAFYARYAQAIRDRAAALGEAWTPVLVERALWANSGGKAAPKSPRK